MNIPLSIAGFYIALLVISDEIPILLKIFLSFALLVFIIIENIIDRNISYLGRFSPILKVLILYVSFVTFSLFFRQILNGTIEIPIILVYGGVISIFIYFPMKYRK
jgi:hypothetical protein